MRIAVIGATGRTGRHVVSQALGQGDDVVALARDPSVLGVRHPRLEAYAADVRDLESLRAPLAGCDAVVSAVGERASAKTDLYSVGIANIMHAMAANDVMRLSAISAVGTFARGHRNLSLPYRLLLRTSYRTIYDDLERMETLIMASGMGWTIVRPPRLTDGERTGDYRIGLTGQPLASGSKISREDLAGFVLKSLKVDTWLHRAVVVSY